jgi:transcriptional regulator with XRE-family HTH domain
MTLVQELLAQSKHGRRELARQDLIVDTTEQVWEALEHAGMTKADLARALETSKANVTQFLSGQRNMTLNTISDIGEAVGMTPRVVFHRKSAHQDVGSTGAHAHWSLGQTRTMGAVMKSYGNSTEAKSADIGQRAIAGFASPGLTGSAILVTDLG